MTRNSVPSLNFDCEPDTVRRMPDPGTLDAVDVTILRILQSDGRVANKDLATQVGVAPSTCLDRVARLKRLGVITGYTATVSPEAVGRSVQAMLAVQLQPHA